METDLFARPPAYVVRRAEAFDALDSGLPLDRRDFLAEL